MASLSWEGGAQGQIQQLLLFTSSIYYYLHLSFATMRLQVGYLRRAVEIVVACCCFGICGRHVVALETVSAHNAK